MLTQELLNSLNLDPAWKKFLSLEFEQNYMISLNSFLLQEIARKKIIFPREYDIFNAYKMTPLSRIKVVILGQDPYHTKGMAHGLAFSVTPGRKIPPSLKNIIREVNSDSASFSNDHVFNGSLVSWAQQGVFLLNSILTVEEGKPLAHQGKGWEILTDKTIQLINEQNHPVVFMLWGNEAKKKSILINQQKHLVISSTHPSPFSAYNGFLGHAPFSQANTFLLKQGIDPINWHNF